MSRDAVSIRLTPKDPVRTVRVNDAPRQPADQKGTSKVGPPATTAEVHEHIREFLASRRGGK